MMAIAQCQKISLLMHVRRFRLCDLDVLSLGEIYSLITSTNSAKSLDYLFHQINELNDGDSNVSLRQNVH
jgi:hypothetical protein